MAPLIKSTLSSLLARSNSALITAAQSSDRHVQLLGRAPAPAQAAPCAGCMDPRKVNNQIYFALFAIIGAILVIGGIWFFFWAKNGGFHWQQGDWDDYKSTVLRKKGPDGKTIYSSTRSTILPPSRGDRIAARSVVGYDENGRKGIMAVRGFGGSHSVYYSDNFTEFTGSRADDMSEVMTEKNGHGRVRGGHGPSESGDHSRRYRDRDLRDYKHEKPARVGGMNRSADGTQYDYSDRSETMTERSTEPLTAHDRRRAKAEKRAQDDAARMERKWRKEAERAAAALARENAAPSSSKKPAPSKATSSPAERQAHRSRRDSRSRSHSPKKQSQPRNRQYSFSGAPDETSTVYTGTYTNASSNRTGSSYYEAYRPLAQTSPQQDRRASSSRHSSASPSKQHRSRHYAYVESDAGTSDRSGRSGGYDRRSRPRGGGGRDVMAGYRRGMDSLASDSE